jgi:hypothetical protein
MGRHERRASLAEFKKASDGGFLDVHLLPADVPITIPLLKRAVEFWRASIPSRKPKCFAACGAEFSADARIGAYLCAVPSGAPTTATISGLCTECWSRLTDDEVERAALKVVRRVMPTATFDPQQPR